MTFEASGQGVNFLLCLAFGYAFGVCFFFLTCDLLKKHKIVYLVLSIIKAVCFATFFIIFKNLYDLPSLKWYFLVAYCLGLYIYTKTLGKIIAKLNEKLYNKVYKSLKNWRWIKSESGKIKQNRISGNRFVRTFVIHSHFGNGVSNDNHKRQKSKNSRVKRSDRTP